MSDEPKCKLCGGEPADWCYGCRSYICDEHVDNPWGPHEPRSHDMLEDDVDDWGI